jgi:hypothetical protein
MANFLRRLRARDLFAAWAVYWLALSLRLTPLVSAIWRATHAGAGKGEVSFNLGDSVLSVAVKVAGQTTYTASRHMLGLALLIAGPPLVLWLLWVVARPRTAEIAEPV